MTPATAAGKLFTVFYILTGIGIIIGFVDAVARASVEQRSERNRLLRNPSGSPESHDNDEPPDSESQ